jgi:hypothetical protein
MCWQFPTISRMEWSWAEWLSQVGRQVVVDFPEACTVLELRCLPSDPHKVVKTEIVQPLLSPSSPLVRVQAMISV